MTCCMGVAALGPEYCTCWEPVFDVEPTRDVQAGPVAVRAGCCGDCAFRNGSPERTPGGTEERDVKALASSSRGFACHVGMPRVIAWRHPDGRQKREESSGVYRPVEVPGRAWLADGSPAPMCAGWWAHRRAVLRSTEVVS